jgi:hypothetical protein
MHNKTSLKPSYIVFRFENDYLEYIHLKYYNSTQKILN